MKENILVFAAVLFLSGCGTMSKEECSNSDWKHVGLIDGRMGKPPSYIGEHRKTCGAEVPDALAYEAGRIEGLVDYCTPRSAYEEGARGNRFNSDFCPKKMELDLVKQFNEGEKTFALKVERREAEADLSKKRQEIADDKSLVGDIGKVYSALSGRSQTETEEKRVDYLSEQVRARNSFVPSGKPPVPTLSERVEANPLPATRNLFAIMTGATLGFGVGHSIQGSYGEKGWKWTAIDAVNIAGFMVNAANCSTAPDPETGVTGTKETGACTGSALLLIGGIFASRIWQAIEIGRGAGNTYSPYSVVVEPRRDGNSLVATWTW